MTILKAQHSAPYVASMTRGKGSLVGGGITPETMKLYKKPCRALKTIYTGRMPLDLKVHDQYRLL